MFDDQQQTDQSHTNNQDELTVPELTLGMNPNPVVTTLTSDDAAVNPVIEPVSPAVSESEAVQTMVGKPVEPAAEVSEPAKPEIPPVPEVVVPEISTHHDSPAPIADLPTALPAAPTEALEDIRRQALEQLSPLVDKLDQSPEERFKTLMMMIQASDNQELIDDAYKSAQAISDEKARAAALLNVVNEINYFTQKDQPS